LWNEGGMFTPFKNQVLADLYREMGLLLIGHAAALTTVEEAKKSPKQYCAKINEKIEDQFSVIQSLLR
jgi:hypothetical protein